MYTNFNNYKILILGVVFSLLNLTAGATDQLRTSFVKQAGELFTIKLALKSPGTVDVDWGDGIRVSHNVSNNQSNAGATQLVGTVGQTGVVKIYQTSNDLIWMNCASQKVKGVDLTRMVDLITIDCANNQIEELDLSQNVNLKSLNCNGNKLSHIDLSSCPLLFYLNLNNNQLTTLDLSKNSEIQTFHCANNKLIKIELSNQPKVKAINVSVNQLSACALDDFYTSLHSYGSTTSGSTTLYVKNNPGTLTSNTTIGANKNWTLDAVGDASGCVLFAKIEKKSGEKIKFKISAKVDKEISVDWGGGIETIYTIGSENSPEMATEISGTVGISGTVLIIGSNIKHLWIGNQELTSLDFSEVGASDILELDCYNNKLTQLDCSKLTALTSLNIGANPTLTDSPDLSNNTQLESLYIEGNNLRTLDISNNNKLKILDVRNNLFNPCSLEGVFRQLPILETLPNENNLYIMGNPNVEKSLTNLSLNNNWVSDVVGDGSGCALLFTVKKEEGESLALEMALNEEGSVIVDWGNGVRNTYTINSDKSNIEGNAVGLVSVYGSGLKLLNTSNQELSQLLFTEMVFPSLQILDCSANGLSELNNSSLRELKEINVSNNNFEAFDISNNTNLERLECESIGLKSLDISSLPKLSFLNISNNLLEVCELNELFEQLPVLSQISGTTNLYINGNTGLFTSNTNIPYEKKWTVDAVGDGTGCISPIVDKMYISLIDGETVQINTSEKIIRAVVYDIRGKELLISTSNQFPIGHYPSGVYVIKVHTSSGITNKKIIK